MAQKCTECHERVVCRRLERHAYVVSLRYRAGELGLGRATLGRLASWTLPPQSGGRSPHRGVATCGMKRFGPGVRLYVIVSLYILLLRPLDLSPSYVTSLTLEILMYFGHFFEISQK